MLYPTAAAWVYQYSQAGIIQTLGKQVKVVDPSAKDQIQAAREYNKAIRSGARLAPNTNVPLSDVHDTESALGLWQYDDILNISKTGMMGRIVIPKAEVDLPIFHGTTESSSPVNASSPPQPPKKNSPPKNPDSPTSPGLPSDTLSSFSPALA